MEHGAAGLIRRAVESDVEAMAAIWRLGWTDGHAGRVPVEFEQARQSGCWTDEVRARLAQSWVACDGDRVVGFVTVAADELEEVYVARSARGSGVAACLLRHGEGLVRENGFPVAWLAVVAGNGRARRFYEREGWHDAGDHGYQASSCGGGPLDITVRRYERSLTATEQP